MPEEKWAAHGGVQACDLCHARKVCGTAGYPLFASNKQLPNHDCRCMPQHCSYIPDAGSSFSPTTAYSKQMISHEGRDRLDCRANTTRRSSAIVKILALTAQTRRVNVFAIGINELLAPRSERMTRSRLLSRDYRVSKTLSASLRRLHDLQLPL